MRELTLPEISSVAGGRRLQTVVVTGKRPSPSPGFIPTFGPVVPTFEPPQPFGGGGFGDGPSIPDTDESDHCEGGQMDGDPPVPDGVDLGDLRNLAQTQGQELAGLRAGDGAEHAIFLIRDDVTGQLFPVSATSGNSDSIEPADIQAALEPFGFGLNIGNFEIVAWNHVQTSPIPSSSSQSLSSNGSDWEFAQSIIDSGIASPNLVTYITTPDGTVYEYGIDEQNTNQVGCEV